MFALNTNVLPSRICSPQAFQTGGDRPSRKIFYPLNKALMCSLKRRFLKKATPLCNLHLFQASADVNLTSLGGSLGQRESLAAQSFCEITAHSQTTSPFR